MTLDEIVSEQKSLNPGLLLIVDLVNFLMATRAKAL
jgi:hypothetical protein